IPPLSPSTNTFGGQIDMLDPGIIFPTIKQFRIPIQYLANLMSAGDTKVIERVLKKMVAMRSYMRSVNLKQSFDQAILEDAGLTEETAVELYELSAIAKYNDRYVIPKSHREEAGNMYSGQGSAGYEFMEGCSGCSLGTEKYEDLYAFSEEYWSDLNGNTMDGRR
ncbi:nitrate reductase subunit beta, partial [Bacillus licheniformis]|nr:nitrate reductase subunit beta [Bacillus licheniformis]